MSAAIKLALNHLDNQAMGIATRKVGGSGGDGGKIINGFPVVHPGSKMEKQMMNEAAELDAINRATRLRFFGPGYQEPVKEQPRVLVRPVPVKRVAAMPTRVRVDRPAVPLEEQQRIRGLAIAGAERRGFLVRLRKVMCWDWGNWQGFITGRTATTPKTWARLDKLIPELMATVDDLPAVRGRPKAGEDATAEQIDEVRALIAAAPQPWGFWSHIRGLARVGNSITATLRGTSGETGVRITAEQLRRVREVVESGAVAEVATAARAARQERMTAVRQPGKGRIPKGGHAA
jgi:hypothetical protein